MICGKSLAVISNLGSYLTCNLLSSESILGGRHFHSFGRPLDWQLYSSLTLIGGLVGVAARQFAAHGHHLVRQHVAAFGPRKWSKIAAHLPGRIGKQCRERWHNHINPEIRKGPWTAEEDEIIVEERKE